MTGNTMSEFLIQYKKNISNLCYRGSHCYGMGKRRCNNL